METVTESINGDFKVVDSFSDFEPVITNNFPSPISYGSSAVTTLTTIWKDTSLSINKKIKLCSPSIAT